MKHIEVQYSLCVLLDIIVASRLAFLLFTTLFFLLRASFLCELIRLKEMV